MTTQATGKKGLNLWMLTALVAGNMVGSGIFLLPAALASYGSISLLSWLITAGGAILLALVFAKLSTMVRKIGGPYAYAREGFGDFIGFQVAYNYWIALWVGNAAIAVAFVGYLGVFFPFVSSTAINTGITAIITVWLLTFVNIIGVRQAGIVQLVTTILKFLPLILIATVGLFFIQGHNLTDHFNVSGKSNLAAITGAATLTLWSFIGLESATVPADDVENPVVNIPKATIIGTLVTAAVYILSTTAVMGIIPAEQLMRSNAPYADAAQVVFGHWGAMFVAAGAVISCFGALNGWTLLQGQIPLASARDGLFLKSFGRTSLSGTPTVGLLVTAVLITLLLLLTMNQGLVQQFTIIILLATLASLIPYLFTTMAELILFIREPEKYQGKRIFKSVMIAIFASIYSFWAIIGSGETTVFYGSLLWFSSIPVYVWMKWQASSK